MSLDPLAIARPHLHAAVGRGRWVVTLCAMSPTHGRRPLLTADHFVLLACSSHKGAVSLTLPIPAALCKPSHSFGKWERFHFTRKLSVVLLSFRCYIVHPVVEPLSDSRADARQNDAERVEF